MGQPIILSARIVVAMPSFNAGKFIGEALRSVLAQTRPADEVIVADDHSDDGTVAAALVFEPRVRVIRNDENRGPGFCRNQAVRASSADYVAFMDSDDLLDPDHLATLAGLLDRYPEADAAFSRLAEFGSQEGIWPDAAVCPVEPRWIFPEHVRNIICISTGLMVRRSAFDRIGGFDDMQEFHRGRRVQAEDYDFTLRLSIVSKFVSTVKPTYRHRWHATQSSVHVAPQRIQQFKYRLRLIDRIKSGELDASLLAVAEEKTRLCWEEWLEWHWRRRDVEGVRMMVEYGMSEPLFRQATGPYVWKAKLPAWGIRLAGRFRTGS